MIQEIRFQCSNCEQKMLVDATAAGQLVICPECGVEQVVPPPGSENPAPGRLRPRSTFSNGDHPEHRTEPSGSESRQELIAASVKNSRLETQVTEMRQQLKKVRDDLTRVLEERDRALVTASGLQEELDQARESVNGYAQTVETLSQQVRQGEADFATVRKELADAMDERVAEARQIQILENRVAAQEQDLATARAELAAADKRRAELEASLDEVRRNLSQQHHAAELLRAEMADLVRERNSLRHSANESELGRELVSVRDQLAVAEKEAKHFNLLHRQSNSEIESLEKARAERDELVRLLKHELEEARRTVKSTTGVKLKDDNEVLRGIIARQNTELEQKHVQLVRLKRARLGVRFVYACFLLVLLLIGVWAYNSIPALNNLNFNSLFESK